MAAARTRPGLPQSWVPGAISPRGSRLLDCTASGRRVRWRKTRWSHTGKHGELRSGKSGASWRSISSPRASIGGASSLGTASRFARAPSSPTSASPNRWRRPPDRTREGRSRHPRQEAGTDLEELRRTRFPAVRALDFFRGGRDLKYCEYGVKSLLAFEKVGCARLDAITTDDRRFHRGAQRCRRASQQHQSRASVSPQDVPSGAGMGQG